MKLSARLTAIAVCLASAAAYAEAPPTLRLPRTFLPTSNEVRLTLDPAKDTFQGQIQIQGTLSQPSALLWLNAQAITVERATVRVGGKTIPLEVVPQPADFVGLRAKAPLPVGAATLTLVYRGKVDDKETDGIFRQKVGEAWYLYSNFEPDGARRAFPCFDEPDSKVPWQLTVEVPSALAPVSNTPVVSDKATGGTRVVTFARTRPLPSYLVAFAVGPFDIVPAGKSSRGAPIQLVVPKGQGSEVAFVSQATGELLGLLEDYFGTPYPYEKLDLLAIPQTVRFGAMENPGLITFNLRLLTARPQDFTIGFQRSTASTITHEMAHQWFGDLVTMTWWDDLWLNEAFATWMEDKILGRWRPDWDHGAGAAQVRNYAMGLDHLATARQVRQPIRSKDDMENAFDGITYDKGAAVIRMFERWVGEEAFQKGVRAYLAKHAWKNASAADFLAAIGEASGKDVATPFATFLDQGGAPLVTFTLACDGAPRLKLAQERFRPLGVAQEQAQSWQIPICVSYPGDQQAVVRECTVLAGPTGELALSQAKSCPAWVLPNEGGLGYYRSAFAGDLLPRLLDKGLDRLTTAERLSVIADVNALVLAGKVDVGVALRLVPRFAGDPDRQLVASVAGIAGGIREMVPDELLPNYRRFLNKSFGARARQLGWQPADGETDDVRLLRKAVVPLVAEEGGDEVLGKEATRLVLAWLDNPRSVDPDSVSDVLSAAAFRGDAALYERFLAGARQASDLRDRQRFIRTLSGFRTPELVKRNIDLFASKAFDPREAGSLVYGGLAERQTQRLTYEAIKARYDVVSQLFPAPSRAYLVYTGTALCDRSARKDVQEFFGSRTPKELGGPRTYAQALESMDLCIQRRDTQRAGIAKFLRSY